MSNSSRKIVAIVLLAAFVLWIVFTVFPIGGPAENEETGPVPASDSSYEPKFQKEGELLFVNEGDTVKQIDIELAETEEEIQYGMMYRKSMDPNTGMLFLMGDSQPRSFWMHNTYVSLDIIFINQNQVVSIQQNAQPLNDQSLPSEGPAEWVLEVKGGFSAQNGIGKGTKIYYRRAQ